MRLHFINVTGGGRGYVHVYRQFCMSVNVENSQRLGRPELHETRDETSRGGRRGMGKAIAQSIAAAAAGDDEVRVGRQQGVLLGIDRIRLGRHGRIRLEFQIKAMQPLQEHVQ